MKNKIIAINIVILLILILNITTVYAGIQSNPNTQYIKTATPKAWISLFRQMEVAGRFNGTYRNL